MRSSAKVDSALTGKTETRSPRSMADALTLASRVAPETPYDIADFGREAVRGLQARVNRNGTITFSLMFRTKGGRTNSKVRRLKIGRLGEITLDEARTRARDARKAAFDGADPTTEQKRRPTVAELSSAYLQRCDDDLKASSAKEYRRLWKVEIAPIFGTKFVDEITPMQVAEWHRRFNSPKSERRRPYVGNRALAVLNAFFTWCEKEAQAVKRGTNPASDVKPFPERKRERFLTSDELERVGAALSAAALCGLPTAPAMARKSRGISDARKSRMTGKKRGPYKTQPAQHFPASMTVEPASPIAVSALRFLMLTGWRVSEVLALEWSEIDRQRRYATLTDTKTGRSVRSLGDHALAVLDSMPRFKGELRVFPVSSIERLWQAVRHAAGIPDVRLHDLRHTFASVAASERASLPIIGKLLGHRDTASTARYAHLMDEAVQRVASDTSRTVGNLLGLPSPT